MVASGSKRLPFALVAWHDTQFARRKSATQMNSGSYSSAPVVPLSLLPDSSVSLVGPLPVLLPVSSGSPELTSSPLSLELDVPALVAPVLPSVGIVIVTGPSVAITSPVSPSSSAAQPAAISPAQSPTLRTTVIDFTVVAMRRAVNAIARACIGSGSADTIGETATYFG